MKINYRKVMKAIRIIAAVTGGIVWVVDTIEEDPYGKGKKEN